MVSEMGDSNSSVWQRLEDSRLLAVNCEYRAALASIDGILRDHPENLEALRLKGNVLEQRALDEHESRPRKLAMSRDYLDAQACYDAILRIDPRSTVALVDLGDHYKGVDAFHQAFKCYFEAIELLERGEQRIAAELEVRELLDTCNDLRLHPAAHEMARRLAERCNALLSNASEN